MVASEVRQPLSEEDELYLDAEVRKHRFTGKEVERLLRQWPMLEVGVSERPEGDLLIRARQFDSQLPPGGWPRLMYHEVKRAIAAAPEFHRRRVQVFLATHTHRKGGSVAEAARRLRMPQRTYHRHFEVSARWIANFLSGDLASG